MSFAVLFVHHLSAPVISIGFALALVATLVAAEERDLRRAAPEAADHPRA